MKTAAASVILLGLLASMLAQAASDEAAERAQLQRQRAEIEARYAQQGEACQHRFAVNDCLDKLRAQRSAELQPLQLREQELDAQQRRARAQAQRERVEQKQREFAAEEGRRMSESVARSDPASAPRREPPEPRKPRESAQQHGQAVQAELAEAERKARHRVEQTAAREREAEERRQSAQKRQQQRIDEGKKPVPPLPVPTAADIAAIAASAPASAGKR